MQTAAYIVTLERAVHRKPQVEKLAANCGLPCQIVPAVDGAKLSPEEIARVYQRSLHFPRYRLPLRCGEVGCFLSHQEIWRRILADGVDVALVLEDDAELRMPEFHAAQAFALANIRAGEYLQFRSRPVDARRGVVCTDGQHSLLHPRIAFRGTVAQLVTREAAAKLLEATAVFDRPVDLLLQMTWLTKTPITVLAPSCVTEVSHQMGGSTIGVDKTLRMRLRNELHRPLYRAQIALLARRYPRPAA